MMTKFITPSQLVSSLSRVHLLHREEEGNSPTETITSSFLSSRNLRKKSACIKLYGTLT